jgi:hypothetical protein
VTHLASQQRARTGKQASAQTSVTTKQVPYTEGARKRLDPDQARKQAMADLRTAAESLRRWRRQQPHLANRIDHARRQLLEMSARLQQSR